MTPSLGLVDIAVALERKGNPKNSACMTCQGFVLVISQLKPSKRLLASSSVEDLLSGYEKGFPSSLRNMDKNVFEDSALKNAKEVHSNFYPILVQHHGMFKSSSSKMA